jgi:hypothetical protein
VINNRSDASIFQEGMKVKTCDSLAYVTGRRLVDQIEFCSSYDKEISIHKPQPTDFM